MQKLVESFNTLSAGPEEGCGQNEVASMVCVCAFLYRVQDIKLQRQSNHTCKQYTYKLQLRNDSYHFMLIFLKLQAK